MNNNGTDRDIALEIVDYLDDINGLIGQINTNLFVPAIVTQPTNQTVAYEGTCTFEVVAVNAVSYQWQRKNPAVSQTAWANTSLAGNKTDTLTFTVSLSEYYTYYFRCKITGKDGSIIYTNEVQVIQPPEPETPDAEG